MAKPVVYGPAYSTYARTCRLALEEKGADYDLVEIDMFAGEHQAPAYLARQPFGKIPAFAHDGLELYETDAITRYVDDAFEGPALVPADVIGRARMAQAISIINSYGYPAMIGQIFIQRFLMPKVGNGTDEDAIAAALPRAETTVAALETLVDGKPYLAGDRPSLADLLLIPIYDYFAQIPEGQSVLAKAPHLRGWWDTVRSFPSVENTRPSLG